MANTHEFFEPDSLRVTTVAEIEALPERTEDLFVFHLTDEKLRSIAMHLPNLRHLVTDGNTRVTDAGLTHLARFGKLETLDLEYSGATNAGLLALAAVRTLRWVDLGFCQSVTEKGISELRRIRPDPEAVWPTV